MQFRPCIDIHNGKVKQIVGGSLTDRQDLAVENHVSDKDGDWFARLYREHSLTGGHIILLNPATSPYYEATKAQAMKALAAWPGGLQIGGGIHAGNAEEFLQAGADKVIVTSYVFSDGRIHWERLERIKEAVGKEHLVLDLSCRKKGEDYLVVTDRWQTFTQVRVDEQLLHELSGHCSEFLVHGVDVEGKASGVEEALAELLSKSPIPATYAGGVGSLADIQTLKRLGNNRVDVTIGSALDLFGGPLPLTEVLAILAEG